MAVKASCTVTLSCYRDTQSVTRYYKLQSSTASAPSIPTTNPPSGWDDTEPSYTSGSTNTLYFCDLTVFSDGTWAYSSVSKSSSYEAAKEAYNKAQNAQNAADNAQSDIDNLEVGGRNLLLGTKEFSSGENRYGSSTLTGDTYYETAIRFLDLSDASSGYEAFFQWNNVTGLPLEESAVYCLSFWAKGTGTIRCHLHGQTGCRRTIKNVSSQGVTTTISDGAIDITLSDNWERYYVIYTMSSTITTEGALNHVLFRLFSGNIAYVCGAKFEIGNKPTDWIPAPEDVESDIDDAQSTADQAQSDATDAHTRISEAESVIQQLKDCIAMLVVDENGASLMTQTEDGWVFSMAETAQAMSDLANALDDLEEASSDTKSAVDTLTSAVNDLGELGSYVRITTDNSKPCIELGTGNSDFKLLITNTDIRFMEGSSVPAYINNQSLYIRKAVINEELQQGNWVWKVRSNGNLGLVWKGSGS